MKVFDVLFCGPIAWGSWVIALMSTMGAIAQEPIEKPTISQLAAEAPSSDLIVDWLKDGNSLKIVRTVKDSRSESVLRFDGDYATLETTDLEKDVPGRVEAIVANSKNVFVVKKTPDGSWLLIDAWRRSDYEDYATVKPIANMLQDVFWASYVVPFVSVGEVLKSPQFKPTVVGADEKSIQLESEVQFRTAWVYPGWKLLFTLDPNFGYRVFKTGMEADQGGFRRTLTYGEQPIEGISLPSEILYEQLDRPNKRAKFRVDGSSLKTIEWTGTTQIASREVAPEAFGITQDAIDALVPPKSTGRWMRWPVILFFLVVAFLCFLLVRRLS